jgi:hypothetical protein
MVPKQGFTRLNAAGMESAWKPECNPRKTVFFLKAELLNKKLLNMFPPSQGSSTLRRFTRPYLGGVETLNYSPC